MLKFGDKVRIKDDKREGIIVFITDKSATIAFADGVNWGGVPLHEIEAVLSDPEAETKAVPAVTDGPVDATPIKPFHAPLLTTLNNDVELLAGYALVGLESMAVQGDIISQETLIKFKAAYEAA